MKPKKKSNDMMLYAIATYKKKKKNLGDAKKNWREKTFLVIIIDYTTHENLRIIVDKYYYN